MIDERTERLINRKIDGELTQAESLELDKILIRSPESQALLEEYQTSNALAAETIQAVLSKNDTSNHFSIPSDDSAPPKKRWWLYLTAASAIAATIVFMVTIANTPTKQNTTQPIEHIAAKTQPNVDDSAMIANDDQTEKLTPVMVIEGPRRQKDQTMRDLFGVYDKETESVYLLEVDKTQQTIVPVSMSY